MRLDIRSIPSAAVALALGLFAAVAAQAEEFPSQSGPISVTTVAQGLKHPWGLEFLPDGRMLVTERPGQLRLVGADGTLSAPIGGVPEVYARGQGGLLDVALDPAFAENQLVYLSYSEPGGPGGGTAVARAKLAGDQLEQLQVIFRQVPKLNRGHHFGR